MTLTFSVVLKGFPEWIKTAEEVLRPLYTPEVADLFETFEDFAVEVYLENKVGD